MNDEFRILRPVILISAGVFVFALILNVCHESAKLRAQFRSGLLTIVQCDGMSNGVPEKRVALPRALPVESLPRGSFQLATPSTD